MTSVDVSSALGTKVQESEKKVLRASFRHEVLNDASERYSLQGVIYSSDMKSKYNYATPSTKQAVGINCFWEVKIAKSITGTNMVEKLSLTGSVGVNLCHCRQRSDILNLELIPSETSSEFCIEYTVHGAGQCVFGDYTLLGQLRGYNPVKPQSSKTNNFYCLTATMYFEKSFDWLCSPLCSCEVVNVSSLVDSEIESSDILQKVENIQSQGVKCGKRLKLKGLRPQLFLPDPHIASWSYIEHDKCEVIWQLPIINEGKMVSMTVRLEKMYSWDSDASVTEKPAPERVVGSKFSHSSVCWCNNKVHEYSKDRFLSSGDADYISPCDAPVTLNTCASASERAVYKLEGSQLGNSNGYRVEIPPVALIRSSCAKSITFSTIIHDVNPGVHKLTVEVRDFLPVHAPGKLTSNRNLREQTIVQRYGLGNMLMPNEIGLLHKSDSVNMPILLPPKEPTNISALLYKTKIINNNPNVKESIFEPFVVVSWKKSASVANDKYCFHNARHSFAKEYVAGIDVFDEKQNIWKDFGEQLVIEDRTNKYGDSESCVLVALPETSARLPSTETQTRCTYFTDHSGLFTSTEFKRFRIKLKARSSFGDSIFSYSRSLDILQPSLKTLDNYVEEIDFENCDEATCGICFEELSFDPQYENLSKLIAEHTEYPRFTTVGNTHKGYLMALKEMHKCPVGLDSCSHLFHLGCALKWCEASRKKTVTGKLGFRSTCPLCIQPFNYLCRHSLSIPANNVYKKDLLCTNSIMRSHFFSLHSYLCKNLGTQMFPPIFADPQELFALLRRMPIDHGSHITEGQQYNEVRGVSRSVIETHTAFERITQSLGVSFDNISESGAFLL